MSQLQTQQKLLQDKIILITGALGKLGEALSRECAQQGATIILLDKDIGRLEDLYDKIEQAGGPQPAIYPMDLAGASLKDFEDLGANIGAEFSRLDGIVHNQNLQGSLMPLMQYDLQHWQKVMQVNLHAPYLLNRFCLPLLVEAPRASVIFNINEAALHGKAYWGAWSVSKAGLVNLMQVMADELESNTRIRVNCYHPGIIADEARAQAYPGENPANLTQVNDILPDYLYLLSDQGVAIRGKIIRKGIQIDT